MKQRIKTMTAYAKHHKTLFVSGVFFVLFLFLAVSQPASINQYYELTVSGDVHNGSAVTFQFDENKGFAESSQQTAYIQQTDTQQVLLRLDPLNKDSTSLVVTVPFANARITDFSATVRLNGEKWYTTSRISGDRISVVESGEHTSQFRLSSEQLSSLQRQGRLLSQSKLALCALLAIIYIITLLRLTCCAQMDGRWFALSGVIGLLIIAFMANTVLIKQPIINHRIVTTSDAQTLTQSESYSIKQSFVPEQRMKDIQFPVVVKDNLSPTAKDDSDYAQVYRNPQEFTDIYRITIANTSTQTVYFAGRITPSMLNSTASIVSVPVSIPDGVQSVTVTLDKEASQSEATLAFQGLSSVTTTSQFSTMQSQGTSAPDVKYLNMSPGYPGFPYQAAIILILLVCIPAVLINIAATRRVWKSARSTALILADYGGLLMYSIVQFPVYTRYIQGFPDEGAHVSYIAQLHNHGGLVPDFRTMQLFDTNATPGVLDLSAGGGFNYLGHPPLYYQIMRYIGGMSGSGDTVYYSINHLRLISFCIGLLALALIFYIGLTRIPRVPLLHLLFGLLIISPPNMLFVMSGVNNDTLALLTVTIFVWGIIRFVERKYTAATYLLIAVGISTSLLTKLTAGVITGVSAIAVLAYALIREHGLAHVWKPAFWSSVPIYLVPIAYFGYLVKTYHTISPSYSNLAYSEYVQTGWYTDILSRDQMGVWDFLTTYAKSFMGTWFNLAGGTGVPRADYPLYSIDRVGVVLVLLLPIALFFINKKDRIQRYLQCALLGLIVAFFIQMDGTYKSFMINGRFGGYSSRYYLCAISILALAVIWLIYRWLFTKPAAEPNLESTGITAFSKLPSAATPLGIAVVTVFIILLVFDGFIYSVLYLAPEISGFV